MSKRQCATMAVMSADTTNHPPASDAGSVAGGVSIYPGKFLTASHVGLSTGLGIVCPEGYVCKLDGNEMGFMGRSLVGSDWSYVVGVGWRMVMYRREV